MEEMAWYLMLCLWKGLKWQYHGEKTGVQGGLRLIKTLLGLKEILPTHAGLLHCSHAEDFFCMHICLDKHLLST